MVGLLGGFRGCESPRGPGAPDDSGRVSAGRLTFTYARVFKRGVRRTKEDAAATRAAVLDASLRVFSRKGYAATRLEEVAAEAGVTRGAVYWHFADKAEL